MTRGELMALRSHHERIRDMYSGSDLGTTQERAIAVIDLALRAIDDAADARLGANVRRVVNPRALLAGACTDVAAHIIVETIADALREEAGDGT